MKSVSLVELLMAVNGNSDITIRSYSGRGMYGKSCVAVIGNRRELQQLFGEVIVDLHENPSAAENKGIEFDEVVDLLLSPRQDSMGLDIVVYWPEFEWTPECSALVDNTESDDDLT